MGVVALEFAASRLPCTALEELFRSHGDELECVSLQSTARQICTDHSHVGALVYTSYIYMRRVRARAHARVRVRARVRARARARACVRARVHVRVRVCVCEYLQIYIHT